MVGTEIIRDPDLDEDVWIFEGVEAACEADPKTLFESSTLFAIDGIDWNCDMGLLAAGCGSDRRKFEDPFRNRPTTNQEDDALKSLADQVCEIYATLFPDYGGAFHGFNWRPMITESEPIHYDTYAMPLGPFMTAYCNIAETPRVYNISHSLRGLIRQHRKTMEPMIRGLDRTKTNLSREIRARTQNDQPPLGKKARRHQLRLAPGTIWFFDTKTVSHEVVYGDGAVGFSWLIENNESIKSQDDIVAEFMRV